MDSVDIAIEKMKIAFKSDKEGACHQVDDPFEMFCLLVHGYLLVN